MGTDIFLRTYVGDIVWLTWALRSIAKFVTGVRDIIICVPERDYDQFKNLNFTRERLVKSTVTHLIKDDYLAQQADKLMADQHTDANQVMFWDSDVVAIRHFSPDDLMIDGKPRCLETPFAKLVDAIGHPATPWQTVVERALGHPVSKERMRAHPMMSHRDALVGLREYIHKVHNMPLTGYIAAADKFSEFNVLHSWAAHHQPDLYFWWDTEERGVPESLVYQAWSWGGFTPDIRKKFERILS